MHNDCVAQSIEKWAGAGSRVRTRDPRITNPMLYQLSYTGLEARLALPAAHDNGKSAADCSPIALAQLRHEAARPARQAGHRKGIHHDWGRHAAGIEP